MTTELIPLTRQEARRYIAAHHRHAEPPVGDVFRIGLARDGELIGVVTAGRPIARTLDDGRTVELTRLTTEGDRNACSRLYSAACRAAFALGYRKVITYTLESERGSSLLASGFVSDRTNGGGDWARPGRQSATVELRMFDPPKRATGAKRRWVREAS